MTLASDALELAAAGWALLPLRGKIPLLEHGVLEASNDLDQVRAWWTRWPRANIGGRVPAMLVVVDVDPRHGGDDALAELEQLHEHLPATLTTITGSGGWHLWFLHPGGALHATIGRGIDIKTDHGYCVLPPSRHPDTGNPYYWVDPETPMAVPPDWLIQRLRRPIVIATSAGLSKLRTNGHGDGPADRFNDAHRWGEVLVGWHLVAGDGDGDGSAWRHPTATAKFSATVRHGLLFNYSPNSGLPVTEPSAPQGLTKFRAWAHLAHHGDLSAAARAYRETER